MRGASAEEKEVAVEESSSANLLVHFRYRPVEYIQIEYYTRSRAVTVRF